MYDTYISQDAQKSFTLFNLDDVDATFEYSQDGISTGFTLLKYQQTFPLDDLPNGHNVVITPHRAGHFVGGTVWNITKGTESIVYAVHFNHRKERHLNATTLVNFSRPSHLIVSATNAFTKTESVAGADRLLESITKIIKRGGNSLVPVDTAGRVVEIAVLLETAWERDESLRDVPLVVMHALSTRTFDFARSMIEWMSDEVVKHFDVSRDNLFVFKHVKLLSNLAELDALAQPCVVLCSSLSMDMGFSRELFIRWCGDKRNGVVLADRAEPGTLYAQLQRHCEQGVAHTDGTDGNGGLDLTLTVGKKVPLQGDELEQWRDQERNRKRLEADRKRLEEEKKRVAAEEEEKAKLEAEAIARGETSGDAMDIVKTEGANDETIAMDISKENEEETRVREFDEDLMSRLEKMDVIQAKSEQFGFEKKEEKVEWDDYGQKIDTVQFIFGEDPGEGGLYEEVAKRDKDVNKEEEKEVIPTKHVEERVNIKVFCEVSIADCSGLSDGDSLKRLLKEVEPRHVTIIGGSEKETEYLSVHLKKSMNSLTGSGPERVVVGEGKGGEGGGNEKCGLIEAPQVMESVDISSDMSVYEVSLDDRLVETVQWDDIGLSRIGFMKGQTAEKVGEVDGSGGKGMSVIEPCGNEDGMQDMDETDDAMSECGHGTYFVGTVMLNKLKDSLVEGGVKAEFAGGALCVENGKNGTVVIVKKVAGQHIVLEGAFSEEYVAVRDLLYKQVVIPQ